MALISPRSFQTDAGALARLVAQSTNTILRVQESQNRSSQQARVNLQNDRRLRLAEQSQISTDINRGIDRQDRREQNDFENEIRTRQLDNQEANTRSLIGDRDRRATREQNILESQSRLFDGDFGGSDLPTVQRDPDLPARPVGGTGVLGGSGVIRTEATGILPPRQTSTAASALFPEGANQDQFVFSEGTIRQPRNQAEVQLNRDEEARLVAQRAALMRQRIPAFQSTRGIPTEILQPVLARRIAANKIIDDQLSQTDTFLQNLRNVSFVKPTKDKTDRDIIKAEVAIATAKAAGEPTLEDFLGVPDVPISIAEEQLRKMKGLPFISTTPPPVDFNGTPTGRQVLSKLRGNQRPGR